MRLSRKMVGCLVLLLLAGGMVFATGGQEQKASAAKPYRVLALVLTMEH